MKFPSVELGPRDPRQAVARRPLLKFSKSSALYFAGGGPVFDIPGDWQWPLGIPFFLVSGQWTLSGHSVDTTVDTTVDTVKTQRISNTLYIRKKFSNSLM